MKPILPPDIISETNGLKDRVTVLERNTRLRFSQRLPNCCLTATGRPSTQLNGTLPTTFTSSGFRTHTDFTLQEVFVDVEEPTDSFAFNIDIDGETVLTVTMPDNVPHIKVRVSPTILLPSTRTLTVTSTQVRAEVGFVTIQLIGSSSTIVNQTATLRFEAA